MDQKIRSATVQALIKILDEEIKKNTTLFLIATRIEKELITPLLDENTSRWVEFGFYGKKKHQHH